MLVFEEEEEQDEEDEEEMKVKEKSGEEQEEMQRKATIHYMEEGRGRRGGGSNTPELCGVHVHRIYEEGKFADSIATCVIARSGTLLSRPDRCVPPRLVAR